MGKGAWLGNRDRWEGHHHHHLHLHHHHHYYTSSHRISLSFWPIFTPQTIEWGRHVLPGLTPLVNTASTIGTIGNDPDEFASKYMSYDRKSNTLMLYFRGIQIQNPDDAHTVCNAIERKILSANANAADNNNNNNNTNNNIGGDTEEYLNSGTTSHEKKVHVVVDYRDAVIANGRVQEVYIREISDLQNRYYLSAKRFGISSFGTQINESAFVGISKTKLG